MISIIIPTLNEERLLPSLLDAICQQSADYEVIVVDGGSRDRTLEVAGDHGVRALLSPPGRGTGICVGAREARGDILFFLHADTTLLPGALNRIDEVLSADARIIGGNFRLVFDGDSLLSRWLTPVYARLRAIGLYYGDSGIFVRRSVYEALGGFRPIALLEDLDFVRRFERFGQTCCIKDPPLITSSRRFERRHPLAMLCIWIRLHVLFWLGVSPDRLAEIYSAQAPRPETVGGVESFAKRPDGPVDQCRRRTADLTLDQDPPSKRL
ncbi:MAG: TIGR04283 family arsenosugar biosynthesis glycosyltransferase [Alphaproteobacteria bacterium]|nr:TIGR04283 family arsenosugar biosynthesis glycosyltransferase [Alphaproteobacteria bacterium]